MAAIVDNLIRTKRAAAVLLEDARKAAALPMEIFFAGMTGDSEAVFEWLNRGGDINAGEEVTQATLLIAAAVTGAALPLEVLIAKGSAVDRRDSHGQTALIFAALYGHAAILRQLAAAGAALHLVCQAGLTAEQHATRAGHWECVRELRALDRSQAHSSDRKRTRRAAADDAWVLPEDIAAAAENGNEEVVISWLEGGGHIDAAHPQASCTLLMCTSAEGREPLVAELLRRGADPDRSVDAGGYTPLMLASRHGHANIVRRLLRAGAKLGVRLSDGATPARLAQEHGHAVCVREIKDHLAQIPNPKS